MHYEKLSKNALYCMYTAGLVSGVVVFVIRVFDTCIFEIL